MQSIAASDEMRRSTAAQHQQLTQFQALHKPMLVSLYFTSSHTNQHTCVTNGSNVPKALSNPMLLSQQEASLCMLQQKEAENAQMRQVIIVLERKLRETKEIQKEIENVKLQNVRLMKERQKQLDLVQQSSKHAAAKLPNTEVRPKAALPKPSLTCPKGLDEPEERSVQRVVTFLTDHDCEEELHWTETQIDDNEIVI